MITFLLIHRERETSPVAILVSYRGRKYKKAIGESVTVKQWNQHTKQVRITVQNTEAALINDRIDKWRKAAERTVGYFTDNDLVPSNDEFFEHLRRERFGEQAGKNTLVLDYFDTYMERYASIRSYNRMKQYRLTKSVLSRFSKETKTTIRFDTVDMAFYYKLLSWFNKKDYSVNYFGSTIAVLRAVLTDAMEIDRLHTNTVPFSKAFCAPSARVDSIYLNDEELLAIYRADINVEAVKDICEEKRDTLVAMRVEAMKRARDIFLVGAYTGLRHSDYSKLSTANIADGKFVIYNEKTDIKTVIPIHWVLQEMMDNGFDFTERMPLQKLNKEIKYVAQLAGIDDEVTISSVKGGKRVQTTYKKYELVSSHTARRSFATNASNAGVPTRVIMKVMGYKRESTFFDYIKTSESENAELMQNTSFFQRPDVE